MKQHPTESLPAYVLGMLEANETFSIAEHIRTCEDCHAEVEQLLVVVAMLPYSVESHTPAPDVKRHLMARVAATKADAPPSAPAGPRRWGRYLLRAGLALLVVASLAFGGYAMNMRAELRSASSQVQAAQQILANPQTVARNLSSSIPGVMARIYMVPGGSSVLLVAHGLQTSAPGTIYTCWVAQNNAPQRIDSFTVRENGMVEIVMQMPQPAEHYRQIMVTLEPSGGSAAPSAAVVISGEL